MSFRDSQINVLLSPNDLTLYCDTLNANNVTVSSTSITYPKLETTNWYLLYSPTPLQTVNILARSPTNKLIQLLCDEGVFSSNVNNYEASVIPRFVVYTVGGEFRIFIKGPAGTIIEQLYSDATYTQTDYGSGTWPTGFTSSTTYDTQTVTAYVCQDRIYTTDTTESTSLTTGSVILSGGLAVNNGLTCGSKLTLISNVDPTKTCQMYISTLGTLTFEASTNIVQFASSDELKVLRSDLAATPTGGALNVYGGIGCRGNMRLAQGAFFHNVTDTTKIGNINCDTSGNLTVNADGLSITSPPHYTWFGYFYTTSTANYINGTYSLTCTTTGTVSNSGGKLVFAPSSTGRWNTGINTDGGNTGCINFKVTPIYNGSPAASVKFFELYMSGVDTNKFTLYHYTDGKIKLQVYDKSGILVFNTAFSAAAWVPVSGTEYEMELNWSPTSTKLFINGTQHGSTISTNITNREYARYYSISSGSSTVQFRECMMFTTVQHTADYTPVTWGWVNASIDSTKMSLLQTTNSTSTTTGALTIAGGLGVAYNVNAGGNINASGGMSSQMGISEYTQGIATFCTTNSSSTTIGALTVAGGAGIAKNLHVGGTIYNFNNAIQRKSFANKTLGVTAVTTWTTRTSAADNSWYSVCWSPELCMFCAVSITGTGTRVMTSSDGITWTTRTNSIDNEWYSVCWSPKLSLFCAVSSTGTGTRVMTSPDGITWTTRTSATDNNWRSVCWSPEKNLFCAVSISGTGNRVMTSPDGTTWTAQTSAANNNWYSVCWSPELGLFCAVSISGTDDRVMTSPDGITWTTRTSASNNNWTSVCWSPELMIFCAVSTTGSNNCVMTSPDGITWTTRTSASSNTWSNITWSSKLGLFVAVSDSGSDPRIMTSPDGITWTSRTCTANNWKSICWSDELGLFCAVSSTGTGTRVLTSLKVYDNISRHILPGILNVTNSIDSSSVITGSSIISGGLGIGKKLHTGDAITIHNASDTTKSCSLTVDTSGIMTVNASGNVCKFDVTDQVQVNATTTSTSSTTGAIVVAGGAGIAENLHVGGTINGTVVSLSSSLTGTWTGPKSMANMTVTFKKVGNNVTAVSTASTVTADATAIITVGTFPSGFFNSTSALQLPILTKNGTEVIGILNVDTSGNATIWAGLTSAATFTNGSDFTTGFNVSYQV